MVSQSLESLCCDGENAVKEKLIEEGFSEGAYPDQCFKRAGKDAGTTYIFLNGSRWDYDGTRTLKIPNAKTKHFESLELVPTYFLGMFKSTILGTAAGCLGAYVFMSGDELMWPGIIGGGIGFVYSTVFKTRKYRRRSKELKAYFSKSSYSDKRLDPKIIKGALEGKK